MSPVRQQKPRSGRSLVLGVTGLVVGLIAVLALFIFAIPTLTEQERIEVRLGDDVFVAGSADRLAEAIREDGPIPFADVAGGDRDVYLQHLGDEPTEGWFVFDARRSGQPRDCTLEWTGEHFEDPCDGTEVSADGEGLEQYLVEVTEDEEVVIDLFGRSGEDGEDDAR